MTTLYANPYNIDGTGFYFTSAEEYAEKSSGHTDRFGNLVEEYSIEYIDGDNPGLFKAAEINQATLERWFDDLEHIDDDSDEGYALDYLLTVIGYDLDTALERYTDVNIHHGSATDYAYELIAETTDLSNLGNLANYIDYDAIARDMRLNGEIYEIERTLLVTNPQDF